MVAIFPAVLLSAIASLVSADYVVRCQHDVSYLSEII